MMLVPARAQTTGLPPGLTRGPVRESLLQGVGRAAPGSRPGAALVGGGRFAKVLRRGRGGDGRTGNATMMLVPVRAQTTGLPPGLTRGPVREPLLQGVGRMAPGSRPGAASAGGKAAAAGALP